MDNNTGQRYRGAQPFSDDELSQRTFFGRQEASESLTNQVLANRLVVVYAKSGVGKSSLLNAGVAPRLREAGYQPLMIRLNDIQLGPTASVFDGVRSEASRQKTEYVHGDTTSLWAFFKTVEFWRGDRLLTPVLVIDQFEELFTLHSEAARDAFLSDLSYIIRGVQPPSPDAAQQVLGDTAPSIHVVLSLREDFLGILEDGADRIPQIMDHRFRLVPLSRQSAAEAMAGPAMLADPTLATRPFTLAPEFTEVVLDYLTTRTAGASDVARRFVEPFHLQLICQRVEQVVAAKAQKPGAERAFTLADFGGEAALSHTLATFYTNAIRSVSEPHFRPVAKRLCEEFLISPEGRRLSIEEHELRKQLRLSEPALAQLVGSRLLRTDRRSDSTYYELSHDALVEPVLATRRTQALVRGWSAIAFGSLAVPMSGLLVLYGLLYLMWPHISGGTVEPVAAVFVMVSGAGLLLVSMQIWRAGWRAHRRYRPRGLRPAEQPMPVFVKPRDKLIGSALLTAGFLTVGFFALAGFFVSVAVIVLFLQGGVVPAWVSQGVNPFWKNVYQHPVQEIGWLFLTVATSLLFGVVLCRKGWRRLHPEAASWGATFRHRMSTHWLAHLGARGLRLGASVLGIAFVVWSVYLTQRCANSSQGLLPEWLPTSLLNGYTPVLCKKAFEGSLSMDDFSVGFFVFSVFCLSLPGVLQMLHAGYRRLLPARPKV